jgi:hypothetical protein
MKLSPRSLSALAAVALAIPTTGLMALSDTDAAAGRAVGKQYSDAIVGVELMATINLTVGDHALPSREVRLEANGTVISPDGLTATSLIEIDPRRTAEAATHSLTLPGDQHVKVGDTEYHDVKLRLANGAEIPAKVVLTNIDLDLAFIMPVVDPAAPKRDFVCVKLDNAAEPAILANYFVISRAAQSLKRIAEVHASTIEGVVDDDPHHLFIPNGFATGCPMIDAQGRVLGLCLTQMVDGHPIMVGGRPSGVVVSAADVASIALPLLPSKPAPEAAPAAAPATATPAAAPAAPESVATTVQTVPATAAVAPSGSVQAVAQNNP